jgi:hypothetical protein
MTRQFRLYRIRPGQVEPFLRTWREGVVPLRETYGYTVEGGWSSVDGDRFAWIVVYDGPLSWEEAEERYYGSPERAALDPDPASFLEDVQTWFVEPAAGTDA